MMLAESAVVTLAQELIRFDTRNPPGNELACAKMLASRLAQAGLEVHFDEYAPSRANIVARAKGSGSAPPLVFSGHIDVVPFGEAEWEYEPLSAHIADDRLYGRGSTDMKGGVAAMIVALEQSLREGLLGRDIIIAISGGEETGCDGAKHIASQCGEWGEVGGLVIAEPTENVVTLGHKGALWLAIDVDGKAAHGAFPERGINAITRSAGLIERLNSLDLSKPEYGRPLGSPSLNIGMINGGNSINSVPDHARLTVDIRTVDADAIPLFEGMVRNELDRGMKIEKLVDVPALPIAKACPWLDSVIAKTAEVTGNSQPCASVSYFTDGGVLTPALGMPPTVILGPGSSARAHAVDEYVLLSQLRDSVMIYQKIMQAEI